MRSATDLPHGLSQSGFHFNHIGTRLATAFALILVILLSAIAAAGWQLWRIEARSAEIARDGERIAQAGRWAALVRTNLERAMTLSRLEAAAGDDVGVRGRLSGINARLVEDMAATAAASADMQRRFGSDATDKELAAKVARIEEFRLRFVDGRSKVRDDIQMGEGTQGIEKELMPLAQGMLGALDELSTLLEARSTQQNSNLVSVVHESQLILAIASVIAIIVAIALAWIATSSITAPVRQAARVARSIAGGDLSSTIDSEGSDEVGHMLRDLARMQERLNAAFQVIRKAVENIEAASGEVAAGNAELSTRTEEAASSLQETASSMEQLAGTVQQTAESAGTANQLARSAADVAHRGGEVVSRVVATMDRINASSAKIADIISVIDGIAFQTNILALNAAVEAARAGEQGRGFAVVAGEVRALAQRAANAAKEVKTMVSESVAQVEAGSRLVQDAGRTMDEIVASSTRVTGIINAITEAARQESTGIGQVNSAVAQLDHMTQQNAALVEQGAAAAESLKAQAHNLANVIGSFRLTAERAGAKAPGAEPLAIEPVRIASRGAPFIPTRSAPRLVRR